MNISELLISIADKISGVKNAIVESFREVGVKGVYVSEKTIYNLPSAIRDIPQERNINVTVANVEDENLLIDNNDIFFIDHFGIAGAYTKEEVAKWTEIEFQPKEYEFADFYGFTETLEDIQDGRVHTVGVLYTPQRCVVYVNVKAGDTITIPKYSGANSSYNSLVPNFSWYPKIIINWGDGTSSEYYHDKGVTVPDYTHTYEKDGIFPITQDSPNGWTRKNLLFENYMSDKIYAYYYPSGVTSIANSHVERYPRYILLPPTINSYGSNFCNGAINLEVLVMPNAATTIGTNFAENARRLKFLVFSKSTNSSSGRFLTNVSTLKIIDYPDSFNWAGNMNKETRKVKFPINYTGNLTIPLGVKDIYLPSSMKIGTLSVMTYQKELIVPEGCTSFTTTAHSSQFGIIRDLYLPSTLTSITYAKPITYLHMAAATPPTLANSSYISASKIYVPYSEDHSILAAYQSATNWSALASKIEEEPA